MKLTSQWVIGFIDGKASFYIGLKIEKGLKKKVKILPEFYIIESKRNIKLLHALKTFFGCGRISNNKGKDSNLIKYRVTNKKNLLDSIIPFFEKHNLKSIKAVEFKKFRRVLLLSEKFKELTIENDIILEKIQKILER